MVEYLPNGVDFDLIFQALAQPIRPVPLEQRPDDPKNVEELAEPRDVSSAAVSKHQTMLMDAGLLDDEKDGRIRLRYLDAVSRGAAFGWLFQCCAVWDDRFKALADHLENEDQ